MRIETLYSTLVGSRGFSTAHVSVDGKELIFEPSKHRAPIDSFFISYRVKYELSESDLSSSQWDIWRSTPLGERMTLSDAMPDIIKLARKIARPEWVEGEYVYAMLTTGSSLPCFYKAYPNGDVSPWTPDQIEMFTNDWSYL